MRSHFSPTRLAAAVTLRRSSMPASLKLPFALVRVAVVLHPLSVTSGSIYQAKCKLLIAREKQQYFMKDGKEKESKERKHGREGRKEGQPNASHRPQVSNSSPQGPPAGEHMAFLQSPDFFDCVDRHRTSLLKAALKVESEVSGMAGVAVEPVTSSQIIAAIEKIVQGVVESLSRNEAPVLTMQNRATWTNIEFSGSVGLQMVKDCSTKKIRSDCPRSAIRFALTMKILSVIYKLVQTDTYATKRDIFYDNVQLYGNQKTLDSIITDISCMLKIPRLCLHILSTSKGCVAGDLVFTEEDGARVICNTNSSVLIPSNVDGVLNMRTHARYILIIEKDATFQRLLDDDFCEKCGPCIVITGKGFPDLNTRLFIRKLWDTFQIPIFTLVDSDPHGIEIMCIYKYGSVAMSFEAHNLTVPSVAWLGLLPSDIQRLNIPEQALIPLSEEDQKKLRSLERRPYVSSQPMWKRELEIMSTKKMKAEIQALTSLSATYLTRVYLPNKLQYGGWI